MPLYASKTDLAITCEDLYSAYATSSSILSSASSLLDLYELTLNLPSVSVPVLSIYISLTFVNVSKYVVPLASIPFLLAAPIPTKKPSGIEITSAQGHEITKKFNAL